MYACSSGSSNGSLLPGAKAKAEVAAGLGDEAADAADAAGTAGLLNLLNVPCIGAAFTTRPVPTPSAISTSPSSPRFWLCIFPFPGPFCPFPASIDDIPVEPTAAVADPDPFPPVILAYNANFLAAASTDPVDFTCWTASLKASLSGLTASDGGRPRRLELDRRGISGGGGMLQVGEKG